MWPFKKKVVEVPEAYQPRTRIKVETDKFYISIHSDNHPFYTVDDLSVIHVEAVQDGWVKHSIKSAKASVRNTHILTEEDFQNHYMECKCLNN